MYFVRHVLAHVDESWRMYRVCLDQRNNMLAMLTLLHVPVQCVVRPHGGDDNDIVKEVINGWPCVTFLVYAAC